MADGAASQRNPGRVSAAVDGGQLPVLYIAGDIHLHGTPEDAQSPFVRFLDRLAARPPARLVLLGDLFEYWLETDTAAARYEPVLSRLDAAVPSAGQGWAP